MTTEEMIAVMQAAVRGEQIEELCFAAGGQNEGIPRWQLSSGPWDFRCKEYRVKRRKPREWCVSDDGAQVSRYDAQAARAFGIAQGWHHVREVID